MLLYSIPDPGFSELGLYLCHCICLECRLQEKKISKLLWSSGSRKYKRDLAPGAKFAGVFWVPKLPLK